MAVVAGAAVGTPCTSAAPGSGDDSVEGNGLGSTREDWDLGLPPSGPLAWGDVTSSLPVPTRCAW